MELKGKNISFKYRNNKEILKDLNISIKSGEVIGLVGNSGSGKSTLSKILAGYIDKNKFKGKVTIDGLNIPKKGFNPVQLIFQHPEKTMNPKWKMRDILFESWGVDENLIEEFGIQKSWFDRWPNELSGGELQRFSVLRALSPNTQFLIADEITTMLDAVTQVQIWDIVINIVKKRNIGMLVVSHDKELINKICDNVVYLDDINNI
ncbi:ATP-binding cassette domain-containing protein [Methanobrevibacter sp. TMH8]|uniref:ABC transporter ATP-binding protein n=1 Tax=Methanobrevibacter sp. TMH8 TaxID=2848611 RepID=UPI001CC9A637|nr:ATP-binding cassette domain-containing protein [Methanobrevibacter sp. TMH8]MBZ9571429.1 ATP-binding cassette domain-containing protein [Methanobrevibacter sp. TMH8]